jgi:8-oxo-dGTP pyrophosphatase MutT (NUDIX family)
MEKRLHSQFVEKAHHQGKPNPKTLVTALLSIDGKVPVFERSKNGSRWFELPGGKPEPQDRDVVDTIVREMHEELGIAVVADTAIFDKMSHPFLNGRERIFIKCHHVSGAPVNVLPKEHDKLHLLEPGQALALLGRRISLDAGKALLSLAEQSRKPRANPVGSPQALELAS